VIHVIIDRIDVRIPDGPRAPKARPASAKPKPSVALTDYLRGRDAKGVR
jgi:hypothetical protein